MKNTIFRLGAALLVMLILAVNVVSAQPNAPLAQPARNQAFVPLAPAKGPLTPQEKFEAERTQKREAWKAQMDTASAVTSVVPRVAPANDNLASATAITVPFSTTVTTIEEATTEAGKLAFCRGNNTDVWFKLTIAAATTVDITTVGSNYDTVMAIFSASGTPASEADLSFMLCSDDDSYTSDSSAYNLALDPGTYYIRVSDYGSTAPSVGSELLLDVSVSGKPLPFYYAGYPYPDTYALAPDTYVWYKSTGATSYDFTMYDITGVSTQVFNLPNLTPAVDSDGLDCATGSYCILTLGSSSTSLITDLKDFEWIVSAKNASGSTEAQGVDYYDIFSTDFSELPTYPSAYSIYPDVQIADPVTYQWYKSIDATSYDFVVNQTLPSPVPNVIQLQNLTAASDSDGLTCNYYQCTLTIPAARAAQVLTNGSTYEWYPVAKNTNGSTPSDPDTFSVDTTPAPQSFSNSSYGLVYNPTTFSLSWYASTYATSYNLHVERTAPSAAVLVDATGLTPAADADALTCTYYCYYTFPTPAATFTNGDYTWSVTAVNANGTIDGFYSPNSFMVNADVAFDLLTPANNAVFNASGEITSFTWQQITQADTTVLDPWTFSFYSGYAPNTSVNIGYLTEAADTDPLTCAAGTCTFNVTGTRLGMNRNIYFWETYTYVEYAGTTTLNSTIFSDYNGFSVGTLPTNFYVKNSDFESYSASTKLPTDWKVKGALVGKVKCNKVDKVVAIVGNCAWFTKGVTTNGSINQILDTTGMFSGDGVGLYAYLNGKNVTKGTIQLKVVQADSTKTKLTLTALNSTNYVYYYTESTLGAAPTKGKLKVSNRSNGGKLYVDYMGAYAILTGDEPTLLPLPLPSANGSLSGRQTAPQNGIKGRSN